MLCSINNYGMIKKYIILIIAFTGLQSCTIFNDEEIFTIYLVRHSEKELSADEYGDPSLTPCGKERSNQLKNFFKDIKLDAVYSTDYIRTKNTSLPTSISKDLEIKLYDGNNLELFSKSLIDAKQDALVVGHSNTTGVLSGILVGEEIGAFDLDIYNRIYQVVISNKKRRLHLLHSSFECNDSI